jgi:ParB family transcriptional regulator, chromosome partitioning protein
MSEGKHTANLRTAMNKAKEQAVVEQIPTLSVAYSAVVLSSFQPRKHFDPASLDELAKSIKANGILQPLLVRPKGEQVELVAGERRYRAAGMVGLQTLPVVVRHMSDQEAAEFALIENLQREDLSPFDETQGTLRLLALHLSRSESEVVTLLKRMYDESRGKVSHNIVGTPAAATIETVFSSLGRISWPTFVNHRLPLLDLPGDVLEALQLGQLAYTKALLLKQVTHDETRASLLKETLENDLSVNDLRLRLKGLSKKPSVSPFARRIGTVATQLKKATLSPSDQKRIETLLKELEAILDKAN